MEVETFDVIYSLGQRCSCPMNMKRANLRAASGPLDWVALIPFLGKIDFILNDFKDFLVLEKLSPLLNEDGEIGGYISGNQEIRFRHDFDLSLPIEKAFPIVVEKYNRRIARFYKNINAGKKVLFLFESIDEFPSKEDLLKAISLLELKFNKKIHISLISKDLSLSRGTHCTDIISDCAKIHRYNLPLFKFREKTFMRKIYMQYSHSKLRGLKKSKKDILNDFIFIKLLSSLIFVPKWRRKFREKMRSKPRFD